mgnify:FL=1
MDELLKYHCNGIIAQFSAQIAEADANPDKWYELYVAEENEGTHSVASGDTFAECFAQIDEYIAEYRFDRLNIDIWTNPDNPQNEAGLLLCSLIYRLIKEYFTNHERNNDKSFGYGSFEFDENDQQVNFRHEYNGTGSIFKDRIAFTFFHNMTCYISELDTDEIPLYEEEDFHPGSTYQDILRTAKGVHKHAVMLFDQALWESIDTLYDQWEGNDVLEDEENPENTEDRDDPEQCEGKTVVLAYAESGDWVSCTWCSRIMLVPTGADKCPHCYYHGALAWHDDDTQETTCEALNASQTYTVINKHTPSTEEYLSDDVLIEEFGIIPSGFFKPETNQLTKQIN